MYRTVRIILIGLLFFALYTGANQLGARNDVFASSMALCCNNGFCHDMPCRGTSSILPCSGSEYVTTCMSCMNVVGGLRSCGKYSLTNPWPTWCVLPNGSHYDSEDW